MKVVCNALQAVLVSRRERNRAVGRSRGINRVTDPRECLMTRRYVVFVIGAVALAGCGGTGASSDLGASPPPPNLGLSVRDDGTTVLQSGERSQVLSGRFEHARLGPGFPEDGRSITGTRVVLQDAANHTSDRVSRFAIVDASLAEAAQMVELRGDFDYDAVSPSANILYLVSHFSVERPEQYVVRSYDVAAAKLDDGVIVDKSAVAEGPMAGTPIARATTAAGDWVYTAYRGDHAFVHALNTVDRFAVCIDLPHKAAKVSDWTLDLDEPAGALTATSPTTGMAVTVDTRQFTATLAATTGAAE